MKPLTSSLYIFVLVAFFLANVVVILSGNGSILNVLSAAVCLLTAFYVAYKR